MRTVDVITLKNIDCEMVFESAQTFMDHEDEAHHYLPYFRMIGVIKEIKGDFPYHISSVYFGDSDSESLIRNIMYYPSPKELAHLIQVGGFYSPRFVIPDVLNENTYSFPAKVDLTIVPPPNPAAYEAVAYDPMSDTMDLNEVNLPIVYVSIVGSGVSRKNDPLLNYYDIDLDESFPAFAMTAESSGYTEPQLLEYVEELPPEPEIEQEATDIHRDPGEAHYITPEEEAEMLQHRDTAYQADMEDQESSEFKPSDPEDLLLARASEDIVSRVRQKYGDRSYATDIEMSLNKTRHHEDDLLATRVRDMRMRETSKERRHDREADASKKVVTLTPPQFGTDARKEQRISENDVSKVTLPSKDSIADRIRARVATVQKEASAKPIAEKVVDRVAKPVSEGKRYEPIDESKHLIQPDVLEEQADVKMDLNPEVNEFVERQRDNEAVVLEESSINKMDEHVVGDLEGADVADARDQAIVDDRHTLELAQEAARSIQAVAVASEQTDKPVVDKNDGKSESKEVTVKTVTGDGKKPVSTRGSRGGRSGKGKVSDRPVPDHIVDIADHSESSVVPDDQDELI